MRISTIGSSTARYLQEGQKAQQSSLERVASGKRINRASDDASGLAIADKLESQARGMGQAMRNANDAISVAQIADGALSESVSIVQTIREKALQAANAGQSTESRLAIQADVDRLLAQLDNISQTTSYNGQKLLSGEFSNKAFQVGANSGETVSVTIGSAAPDQLGDAANGSLSEIDLTTPESAQAAVDTTDAALAQLNDMRTRIGTTQNQLESTVRNLSTSQINVLASESTIRDTDYAEESMMLGRMKLLNRARALAHAQANAKGENVLNLLKG